MYKNKAYMHVRVYINKRTILTQVHKHTYKLIYITYTHILIFIYIVMLKNLNNYVTVCVNTYR